MDFNATIDLIIRDLDEAREIIDDLKRYQGVPLLQVELAKSKCKSAGEVIALLKTIQSSAPVELRTEQQEVQPEKTEIPVKKKITAVKPEAAVPPQVPEKKIQDQPEMKVPDKPETKVPDKPETKVQDKPEKKTAGSGMVADSFSNLSNSLHEQFGKTDNEEILSETLKTKPITNLSEAIGVNDRFFFIREIFNGNHEAYIQAILKLDKADNLSDAMAIIMSYTGDNNENEAVTQLLELLKRKLPSNE